MPDTFPVLDTHTGGEITRVVIASDLGLNGNSATRHIQQLEGEMDWVRQSLTSEPRGSEYAVGAVVCPPSNQSHKQMTNDTPNGHNLDHGSIVFFNNVGYLGMCGHGLIGVVEALRYRGLIDSGTFHFLTPPGQVTATLCDDQSVQFEGVRSFCYRQNVSVRCEDGTTVTGDIAYGGNWFFLSQTERVNYQTLSTLLERSRQIQDALDKQSITGANGARIDHVELFCPLDTVAMNPSPAGTHNGSRNFVLCPGGHYDRSPCGTGTSAKLACLAARGQLNPGDNWIQESITGSQFTASYQLAPDGIKVSVQGRAHIVAETTQIFDPADPLRFGIRGSQV